MIGTGIDEQRITDLEHLLQTQLDTLDDPLAVHEQLCHLLSPSPSRLLPALERATRSLLPDARYTNDPRHLRLWLQYAKHVREPLQVFAFLEERGVGRQLAGFYEEWAWCVKRCGGGGAEVERILRVGVERGAQPLERLKKTFTELTQKSSDVASVGRPSWSTANHLSWTNTNHNGTAEKKQICRYNKELIEHGRLSFEEARARLYSIKNISKSVVGETVDMDSDDIDDLAQPVNPDDLTHISVYKDTTVEAKEMAKMMKTLQPPVMMLKEGLAQSFPIPDFILRVKSSAPVFSVNGNDKTVQSVLVGKKKYYIERQLGKSKFLAVDLEADTDSDARVVLGRVEHREVGVWLQCDRSILPQIIDIVLFNDNVAVLVVKYYELSSLGHLLQVYDKKHQPMDNRLVLFYTRSLLTILLSLTKSNLIANSITLDSLLISSSGMDLDTVYLADGQGGWSDRRLLLSGLPKALPLSSYLIGSDAPVNHIHLDWSPVRNCLLRLLHADDPTTLSPQWQQLFTVLSEGDTAKLQMCINQIDSFLSSATNPTLKALIVRQEMMLLSL